MMIRYGLKWISPVLACLLAVPAAFANPAAPVPMVLPEAPDPATQDPASENLRVTLYEVELGQTLFIPIPNISFNLVQSPQFVSVNDTRADGLEVRGEKIGETLILIWAPGGVQSVRVRVLRPSVEAQMIDRAIRKSSKTYRSQRDRSFKIAYDGAYSLLEEDRVLGRVTESRKLWGHRVKGWGQTPLGETRAGGFYEYRKEHALEKSVAIPRDFYFGLYETDLPFLKHYDLQGGTQYSVLSKFGFPGARYNGLSLQPSVSRQLNPRKGQTDVSWFAGEKRDGSIIDNPAGVQNRQLEGKVTGERVDHYFWPGGKVSLGGYHQWAGPRTALESKHNFDGRFHVRVPYVELEGEGGLDEESRGAGEFRTVVQNRFAGVEGRYYNVNNHYGTITGSVQNRANRGMELRSSLYPLIPFNNSDAVSFRGNAGWLRNHLSVNPDRNEDYIKWQQGNMLLKLPARITSDTSIYFLDQRASAFPFTERRVQEELSKDFSFNKRLVNRLRLSVFSGIESFRDAEETQGFNSTRYELGTGANLSLRGGFWLLTRYAWNFLREEDLPAPPSDTTHPHQLTLSAGWSHAFRRVPMTVNADVRYVEEGDTHGKIHQPYLNEDRLEGHAGLSVTVRDNTELFADSRIAITQSTIGAPDHAEFSVTSGLRMLLDTGFYIARKGMVEGYVFNDKNGNGLRDAGEPGFSGYEIKAEGGGTALTNAEGYYRLKIKEGPARVSAATQIPEGFFYTTVNWQELEILPKSKTSLNFGLAAQFQIRGRAFVDVNRNGLFEKDDIPMPKIRLTLASGQTTVTSPDGFYSFLKIPPGINKIRVAFESVPVGYRTETAVAKQLEAAPGDLFHFDVILRPMRGVSGYVFDDLNQNLSKEPDEPGIAGVQLAVEGKTTRTGRNGRFQVTELEPGRRILQLIPTSLPAGYQPLQPERTLEIPAGPFQRADVHFPLRKSFRNKETKAVQE